MKTKITLFLIVKIFFCINLIYAQDFSTKFYLTDKYGSKDTLVIGYSSLATFGIDAEYGEIGYNIPINSNKFQSSIIINGSNKTLWEIINQNAITTYSKKQIVPFNNRVYIEKNAIGIMIPVDSMPITVKWDKSQFKSSERDYSLITDWTIGGWFDSGGASFYKELKDADSIQIRDRAANYFFNDGISQHPMFVFYVAFANSQTIFAGNENIKQTMDFVVYPKITHDFVNIKNNTLKKIKDIRIVSLSGTTLFNIEDNTKTIDVSLLPKGMYIIRFGIENKYYQLKFIKI